MKTYIEAAAFLGGKPVRSIPSIRSTIVSRINNAAIGVFYHGTPVVTYHDDGTVTLRTGGWHTSTTKVRINDFSPARIYQKDFNWYFNIGEGHVDFIEGMTVDANGLPTLPTHDESVRS